MTQTITALHVHPIDPARLAAMRCSGYDEQGNPFEPFGAEGDGGEPLRCCLQRAVAGESIALISHAPFDRRSPWREIGPVFVHAEACDGPDATDDLPAELRTGPAVLRPYRGDGSMHYEHITLVADGTDLAPAIATLLADDEIDVVHVRTLRPQCFLYAVDRALR